LRTDALAALHLAGLEGCELSLMLVDDRRIRVLNRDFRGKDESTDVLSFPQFDGAMDDLAPGRGRARRRRARPRPDEAAASASAFTRAPCARVNACACIDARARAAGNSRPPLVLVLGDVVISVDTARRQSHALGIATAVRMRTLLIHGLLHLLGYDHERSPAEARSMFKRERELAARLAEPQEQAPPGRAAAAPARGAWPPAAMPHEADARLVPRGTGPASGGQVLASSRKSSALRKRPTRDDSSR